MKKFFLLLGMMLLFVCPVCHAEDFRFVDAVGSVGYYLDADSISFSTAEVMEDVNGKPERVQHEMLAARVAVKKPAANRMYIYAMQLDCTKHAHQILNTVVMKYDTKEVVEATETPQPEQLYGLGSPLNSVVEYAKELQSAPDEY